MKNPKIFKLFLDTHMGLSHDGLSELATKAKVKMSELASDDLLMFMNKGGDKMKILGGHGRVIGYLKMPNREKIMTEALQYIPRTFGSNGFDYSEACRIALNKRLN